MLQFCTKHGVIRIYHRVILFHALLYCAVDHLVNVSAQYKFVFYLFIIYYHKLCHQFQVKGESMNLKRQAAIFVSVRVKSAFIKMINLLKKQNISWDKLLEYLPLNIP